MEYVIIILQILFFVLFIIGCIIYIGVRSKARDSTDKKLGYGHTGLLNTLGTATALWPREYYKKNYLGIKDEYKDKVNAWHLEHKKAIRANRLFYISILLIILGFVCLIISGYLQISYIRNTLPY